MTFSDYAEVAPGLFAGSHPEPEDPFDLGADVVVCLAPGTSVGSVPRNSVLVHWPIKDGPISEPEVPPGRRPSDRDLPRGGQDRLRALPGRENRSVSVAARVLMGQGMTAEEAILHVRERRRGSHDQGVNFPIAGGPHADVRCPVRPR